MIKKLFNNKNENSIEVNSFNKKVLDKFYNRRSVRNYSQKKPDFEIIYNIIEAAFNSPVAGNIINYEIVLVEDKDKKLKLARACENQIWINEAPYVIVILSDKNILEYSYPKNYEKFAYINTGAFTESLINLATIFEIDSCWIGAYNNQEIGDLIKCDPGNIVGIVTMGYSNESLEEKDKKEIYSKFSFNTKENYER